MENNSDSGILVTYTLSKTDGFPIFDETTEAYAMRCGDIDWERKIMIEDKDTSALGQTFVLPPKSILVIGHLSNNNYTNCNYKMVQSIL